MVRFTVRVKVAEPTVKNLSRICLELCSFRQGLASRARVHVLLQQRVRSRVLRPQSKQLVNCLLWNQLSPTDLGLECAPRFSGPCRFFEQSLILATHHYCGGELLRHNFSPSLLRRAFLLGFLHFSCRTGKSRVQRILSPDNLFMGTSPSTQKRTFRVSRLYFLHRCPREAGGAGIAPVTTPAPGQKNPHFTAVCITANRRSPPFFVTVKGMGEEVNRFRISLCCHTDCKGKTIIYENNLRQIGGCGLYLPNRHKAGRSQENIFL